MAYSQRASLSPSVNSLNSITNKEFATLKRALKALKDKSHISVCDVRKCKAHINV